ncbi:MAG: hypothetical protein IT160_14785 [Bryobacterales bacterium]|nr:hypothetical protein [Bryobacterales bacterium]
MRKIEAFLQLAGLAIAANAIAIASPPAAQRGGSPRTEALAVAKRTGYSPVVPVPAEDTIDWAAVANKAAEVPRWLTVKPAPTVNQKAIVTHHAFYSKAMRTEIGYNVFLPPGYQEEKVRRYPVIYWAHGRDGNEYKDIGNAIYAYSAIAAGQLGPLIIVFVNGLAQSCYLDSSDGKYMSETYIIRELIPHIDSTYRTIATRDGRGISGMSMGGFGCLHLAFKYPEVFSSVVSYGATLLDPNDERARSFRRMLNFDVSELMAEHPFALARKHADALRGHMGIRIVCGTRDKTMLPSNRQLHELLSEIGIDHEYEELSPYGHDINGMYARAGVEGLRFALVAADKEGGRGKQPARTPIQGDVR